MEAKKEKSFINHPRIVLMNSLTLQVSVMKLFFVFSPSRIILSEFHKKKINNWERRIQISIDKMCNQEMSNSKSISQKRTTSSHENSKWRWLKKISSKKKWAAVKLFLRVNQTFELHRFFFRAVRGKCRKSTQSRAHSMGGKRESNCNLNYELQLQFHHRRACHKLLSP